MKTPTPLFDTTGIELARAGLNQHGQAILNFPSDSWAASVASARNVSLHDLALLRAKFANDTRSDRGQRGVR